jgi:hypothetical protein
MEIDPFILFRFALAWLVGVYVTIVTLQSLYGWWVYLAGSDRYISLARRYLIVHALRLRFTSFFGDVIICLLLSVAFAILWKANINMNEIAQTMREARDALGQP